MAEQSVGAGVRAAASRERQHKGPADAVIREASAEEINAAFGSDAEMVPPAERKVGGQGSTRGIRLALPDQPTDGTVEAAPDAGVLKNQLLRERRRNGTAPPRPRRERTIAGSAMPEGVVEATETEPEDWELASGTASTASVAPVVGPKRVTFGSSKLAPDGNSGDLLERARTGALALLASIPDGMELYIGESLDPTAVPLVMGIGLLIGQRDAAYRGDSHYRITAKGRETFAKEQGDL